MDLLRPADLLSWRDRAEQPRPIEPWRPMPLTHGQWPPDYRAVYAWRIRQLSELRQSPLLLRHAKAYYARRPAEFIMHWMDTYNPRKKDVKWMPFVFFERQKLFIDFLQQCRAENQNGLVEKCRDAGVTWLAVGYSVHSWLFIPNDTIGWGSRKQDLVDRIGDPDTIFEKMRQTISRIPDVFLPLGFVPDKHATFMKLINPENGSVIKGEAGDNIGRGGRTSMYIKDESSYYERAEKIEAALGDNTNVQIDISSVNGLGNVFHRRRENGVDWSPNARIEPGFTRVFVFDWRDHPEKTQEWYDQRRARFEREGMLHIFAQEVERNYSAAVSNTLIPMEWITAAVDAHLRIRWRAPDGSIQTGVEPSGQWSAGLDVADEGADRNALALRRGIYLADVEEWGERDAGVTTRRAIVRAMQYPGIRVCYDSIGIGASVKAEYNRLLIDEQLFRRENLRFDPWNAGAAVRDPYARVVPNDTESVFNRDMFGNLKAQAWWSFRTRCYKTWKNVNESVIYPVDELVSIDSKIKLLHQLKKELAQVTVVQNSALKTIIDKKPDGMPSPNLADATIMAFFPAEDTDAREIQGRYSA